MTAIIRKLRHWKQRFDPKAEFIFRRASNWDNKQYRPGDKVPDSLKNNKRKLQFMWDAKRIELAEFKAPKSTVPPLKSKTDPVPAETNGTGLPEGWSMDKKGNWSIITDPEGGVIKLLGKKKTG